MAKKDEQAIKDAIQAYNKATKTAANLIRRANAAYRDYMHTKWHQEQGLSSDDDHHGSPKLIQEVQDTPAPQSFTSLDESSQEESIDVQTDDVDYEEVSVSADAEDMSLDTDISMMNGDFSGATACQASQQTKEKVFTLTQAASDYNRQFLAITT